MYARIHPGGVRSRELVLINILIGVAPPQRGKFKRQDIVFGGPQLDDTATRFGLALNIRGILPPAIALTAFVVVMVLGALVLNDEITRMRFLAYAIAPQIVTDLDVAPATGQRYELLGFDLTVPPGWTIATGGIPGEAARFESSTATLVVARARGAALDTADSYADFVGGPQRVGLHDTFMERSVVRINGVVVLDDRYGGTYEGRHVIWRQFTAVPGAQGLALLYRVVQPADDQAALAEAAAIAATWHINAQGR